MIKFSYSALLEETLMKIKYFSGKRAQSEEDYFKYGVCKADLPLLEKLCLETAATLCLKSADIISGYKLEQDLLNFSLRIPDYIRDRDAFTDTLGQVIRMAIVNVTVSAWLSLTGVKDCRLHIEEMERELSLINEIKEKSHFITKPSPRRMHPPG